MKAIYKILIGAAAGGLLGYAYYYFIGCNSGSCPLTSTWYVTTLYGAAAGIFLGIPSKKMTRNGGENGRADNKEYDN